MIGVVAVGAAMVSAAVTGFCSWQAWDAHVRATRLRQQVIAVRASSVAQAASSGDALIQRMVRLTGLLEHGQTHTLCPPRLSHSPWFIQQTERAGLSANVSEQAFCEMRFRMAVLWAAVGCAVGWMFSFEFSVLLTVAGAIIGWRMPVRAVKRRKEERSQGMESHLPEMLDVLALGMGSGLSFDAALRLYGAHFETEVSRDLMRAQSAWASGLESREDALRRLTRSYDSPTFARVVETWIRSLRLGTSMVDGLAAEGVQARASYKAKREESIAKAPVKMMVPTGTLILPAMLVLVLGPVLLELMNGGF